MEKARHCGMVRRHNISNRRSYVVVKTDDRDSERLIYLYEPRSQMLDHTMTTTAEPSKIKSDWAKMIEMNKIKPKKNFLKIYSNC